MKTKHTPGPWFFDKYTGGTAHFCDKSGSDILKANDRISDDERAANVRLVAAAPSLLESLQSLVNTLEAAWSEKQLTAPRFVQCQLGTEVRHAIAAIAKAEGRA